MHSKLLAVTAQTEADQDLSLPRQATELDSAAATVEHSFASIWQSFLASLPQILGGVLVLVVVAVSSMILRRIAHQLLRRTRLRRSLRELFSRLFFIGYWVLGLLLAAMIVFDGLTPTKALGGLGIASVAVGFAFKDIFENFFAGVLILWRFPFDNGDFIECGDLMGRVEEITIRNTMVRRPTGELIIVPNSRLFTEPVEVLTDQNSRRIDLICGVAYGEDVREAVEVIRAAVEACETPDSQHEIMVLPREFASSSIDIEVSWWADPRPLGARQSRAEVVTAIKVALDEAGIEIPFPYRTLTFKPDSALHVHAPRGEDGNA